MIRLDRFRVQGPLAPFGALLLALACSETEAPKSEPNTAGNGGSSGSSAGTAGAGTAGRAGAGGGSSGGAAGSSAGSGTATAGAGAGGSSAGQAGTGAGGSGGLGGIAGSSAGGAGSGGQAAGAGGVDSAGTAGEGTAGSGSGGNASVSLLLFSRTTGFRHDSIPVGVAALSELAEDRAWALTATEDPTLFTDAELGTRDAVIFLNTTGDVLDEAQKAAFERFIRAGGGYVGIHAASDTEFDWPFYGALVGAYFSVHPDIQEASIRVEDDAHPATLGLPDPWRRTDEWYNFRSNPRPDVDVLLTLDESSYAPGSGAMGSDHPIAWCHEYEGGRSFYTALGHTDASYSDPLFLAHVAGGIEWVLGP